MHRTFINTPIVSWLLKLLAKFILLLTGWKTETPTIPHKKCILIGAPHTSNWDFPHGMTVTIASGWRLYWVGKHTLFKGIAGPIMRWLGGMPLNRSKAKTVVESYVELFEENDELVLMIAPEGTRKKVDKWKSGFYRVAQQANVPIVLGFLDFRTKTVGFGPSIIPTGDYEADMKKIKQFYTAQMAKHPEQFGID